MPEVWHIQTLRNQNLEFYINNMHSSSSITSFYLTFQKISLGLSKLRNLCTFIG